MSFFKKNKTRMAAAVTAVLLAAVSAFTAVDSVLKYQDVLSRESSFEENYIIDEAGSLTVPETNGITDTVPYEDDLKEYENIREERNSAETSAVSHIIAALVILGISVLIMLYVAIMGGYDEKSGEFRLRMRDRIPGELFLALLAALPADAVIFGEDAAGAAFEFIRDYRLNYSASAAVIAAALTLVYAICAFSFDTLLNRFKCRKITDTFFTAGIIRKLYREFIGKKDNAFTKKFFLRILIAILLGIAAFCIGVFSGKYVILAGLVTAVFIWYICDTLKDINAVNDLSRQITAISNGDYTPAEVNPDSAAFRMTSKLNCISDGIKTAVEDQIKSERMKIELVTNVSHDLKTPLTSIISYVDLLSKEELGPEARDYVAVLEQKTQRLKTIVSDVFDLAKAASCTDVNTERINSSVLVRQVLADMEDRINSSRREIRTEINAEIAYIEAEGKKMYRVMQNITDNALKYSMPGTRIFLRLDKTDGKVIISLKNTASYEMNFSSEEITERFVRGDKSRTTEGSGLGLAIAKSFTEACGGIFEVNIDGDVFTASLIFDEV